MKDKKLHLHVMRHNIIEAQHWYVLSEDGGVLGRYNHFEDAWEYAKSIAYVKNIEFFD